ncbi:Crp/Fnr family transcriptional regulator [Sulfurivermis fontis]|uniref:Crp/Fnr family transcriptional regulator n=1 Tax=Sulfurivermis fontis TaxID=1972068 RepID=UPI000FDA30ED|nr:Crp/Fnr family transcriptional regulator [Sulfurivermis fontis]
MGKIIPVTQLNAVQPARKLCPFDATCPYGGCGTVCIGERRVREGERLMMTGAVFVVRTGCIKLAARNVCHPWVAFYLPGEIIGLGELAGGIPAPGVATATMESRLCRVPYPLLRNRIIERSGFALTMISAYSQELKRLRTATLRLGKPSEARVAALLLELATRQAQDDGTTPLDLPMPRNDIARHLNLTPETVSRVFGRLAQNRVIEVDDRLVYLLDRQALAGLAAGRGWTERP